MKKKESILLKPWFCILSTTLNVCIYAAMICVPVWGYFVLLTGKTNPLLWPKIEQMVALAIGGLLMFWMLKFFIAEMVRGFKEIFKKP